MAIVRHFAPVDDLVREQQKRDWRYCVSCAEQEGKARLHRPWRSAHAWDPQILAEATDACTVLLISASLRATTLVFSLSALPACPTTHIRVLRRGESSLPWMWMRMRSERVRTAERGFVITIMSFKFIPFIPSFVLHGRAFRRVTERAPTTFY